MKECRVDRTNIHLNHNGLIIPGYNTNPTCIHAKAPSRLVMNSCAVHSWPNSLLIYYALCYLMIMIRKDVTQNFSWTIKIQIEWSNVAWACPISTRIAHSWEPINWKNAIIRCLSSLRWYAYKSASLIRTVQRCKYLLDLSGPCPKH